MSKVDLTAFGAQALTCYTPVGLSVQRAEGSYIYDENGKAYLDFVAGIAVANLGYGHPSIVNAIKEQVDQYMHVMVYGEFIQKPSVELSNTIVKLLPPKLNCCYMVNSGTEANEAALKLAKRVTGRMEIIGCKKAYHGSTHGSLSATGNESKKAAFRPLLPGFKHIAFNNTDDLQLITDQTAAVIIETIQGDAGVRIPSKEYLQALRKKCTETGALLIMDEIQVGMGRTGKMFAFEHFGVEPDILTLGKALGGGMPIGMIVSSKKNLDQFCENPILGHITTFGGNPVCAASALAFTKTLLAEDVISGVEAKGELIECKLSTIPAVKTIRRKGMMLAVDLESEEAVNKCIDGCLEDGLILFRFLSCPGSFRISPPLNISDTDLEKGCEILRKNLTV